jgi:hypothetical protein
LGASSPGKWLPPLEEILMASCGTLLSACFLLALVLTVKMEAIHSYEMSVNIYRDYTALRPRRLFSEDKVIFFFF